MQATTYNNNNYGGDQINVGRVENLNYVSTPEESFFELQIENLNIHNFKIPHISIDLLKKISEQHFLIISGNLGIDKSELALYIVSQLFKESKNKNQEVNIKQWRRSHEQEYVSIRTELQKSEESTIFILLDIQPNHLIEKLHVIYQTVKQSNHYVLITTEVSFSSWHIPNPDKDNFFPDLIGKIRYEPNLLIQELKKLIDISFKEKGIDLISNEISDRIGPNFKKLLEMDFEILQSISEDLETPAKISRFVELYSEKVFEFQSQESQVELKGTSNKIFP